MMPRVTADELWAELAERNRQSYEDQERRGVFERLREDAERIKQVRIQLGELDADGEPIPQDDEEPEEDEQEDED